MAEHHIAGGRARASALSPERRREIARQAAQSRWSNPDAHARAAGQHARKALVALIAAGGHPRHIDKAEMERKGLKSAFRAALKAGLIQSAGFECSVAGDDWLASPEGQRAMIAATAETGDG